MLAFNPTLWHVIQKVSFIDYLTTTADMTLDVVFSRFRGSSFTLRQKPKEVPRSSVEVQDRERKHALPARNSFGLLPQCEQKTPKS